MPGFDRGLATDVTMADFGSFANGGRPPVKAGGSYVSRREEVQKYLPLGSIWYNDYTKPRT